MKKLETSVLKAIGARNVALAVAAWLLLEILVFIFVAQSIGLFTALLLAIGTSLIGLADIRRLLDYLKHRTRGQNARGTNGALFDGALQALGSLLLLAPGFASDFVGLALKSPSIRSGLARRLTAKKGDPRIIDLSPGEWRYDKPKRAPRKHTPRKKPG